MAKGMDERKQGLEEEYFHRKNKEAIDLYKEVKEKFYDTPFAPEADKYLAKLGEYN